MKSTNIIILFVIIVFLLLFIMPKKPRIVVFDLDETLGYFSELGLFWDGLENYSKTKLHDEDMFVLLDTYPEFLRPNILPILNYLKHQKKKGACSQIMIYTNNQGPKSWAVSIKNYFEHKLQYKLFDKVIAAFKVGNKQIEPSRTTHDKTVDDFFNCTKLPSNSQICFLDDLYHPEMAGDNVYYIHLKPYKYTLFSDEMIDRFFKCSLKKYVKDQENFRVFMSGYMKGCSCNYKSENEQEVDRIISKKIVEHLQTFFINTTRNKTIKKHGRLQN